MIAPDGMCALSSGISDVTMEREQIKNLPASNLGIGKALELLKDELLQLQEQDVLLLKQLMNIHYSLRMLKRKLSRRTNSFNNLIQHANLAVSPSPVRAKTLAAHSSLSRVMSEPSRSLIYQRSLSITEEDEEEEEDELAESFNSSGSEDQLKMSLNLDPETNALLSDMPMSLRRKYLSSLNHNSAYITTSVRTNNTPSTQNIVQNSSKDSLSSNRKVALSVKEPLKEDNSAYDSDSSCGIEITAL